MRDIPVLQLAAPAAAASMVVMPGCPGSHEVVGRQLLAPQSVAWCMCVVSADEAVAFSVVWDMTGQPLRVHRCSCHQHADTAAARSAPVALFFACSCTAPLCSLFGTAPATLLAIGTVCWRAAGHTRHPGGSSSACVGSSMAVGGCQIVLRRVNRIIKVGENDEKIATQGERDCSHRARSFLMVLFPFPLLQAQLLPECYM